MAHAQNFFATMAFRSPLSGWPSWSLCLSTPTALPIPSNQMSAIALARSLIRPYTTVSERLFNTDCCGVSNPLTRRLDSKPGPKTTITILSADHADT